MKRALALLGCVVTVATSPAAYANLGPFGLAASGVLGLFFGLFVGIAFQKED